MCPDRQQKVWGLSPIGVLPFPPSTRPEKYGLGDYSDEMTNHDLMHATGIQHFLNYKNPHEEDSCPEQKSVQNSTLTGNKYTKADRKNKKVVYYGSLLSLGKQRECRIVNSMV